MISMDLQLSLWAHQKENANRRDCDDPLGDSHHDDGDGSEEGQNRFGLVTNHCNRDPENLGQKWNSSL